MTLKSLLSEVDPVDPKYLIVSCGAEQLSVSPLKVGASVFVGSGSNCKIQLLDESVQQLQCMLLLQDDNVLTIQDWNTGTTFLNDNLVSEETNVRSGDVITVGPCCLTAVLDAEFHHGFAVELLGESAFYSTDENTTEDDTVNEDAAENTDLNIDLNGKEESAISFDVGDDPVQEDDQEADTGFKYDFDADLKEDPLADNNIVLKHLTDKGDFDSASTSVEVEQLRFELADRDAQITILRQQVASAREASTVDESDTLKLVSRLEELLGELNSSDKRVQGLEELLRVSEDATMAEREERSQINKWLTEVEKRIGQREAEAQAEIASLTRQVQMAKRNTNVIQTQFESMSAVSAGTKHEEDALAALNKQVEALRTNLQEANDQNRELVKRSVLSDDDIDFRTKMFEAQDELAKVRLEASKERAAMARRHAELESIRDELEMRVNKPVSNSSDGDARIRALREHLKDIHAEEKAAKAKEKSNSLGGRIANLLTRLR